MILNENGRFIIIQTVSNVKKLYKIDKIQQILTYSINYNKFEISKMQ